MRKIIAKFKCQTVDNNSDGQEHVWLGAVTSDTEVNKIWSKYTPSGSLNICITNPDAQGAFIVGKEYFIEMYEG